MAKKLIAIHSKRRKTYRRGQIDIRKTLRNNMQYDGNLFDLRWNHRKLIDLKSCVFATVGLRQQLLAIFADVFVQSG